MQANKIVYPLLSIQDTVTKYAEIISKITHVDVEVVDTQFMRVAGTGIYSQLVNTDMSVEGYVYRHVMSTGNRQVISDPGNDPLCAQCPQRCHCRECFEISTPIKVGDEIIGVIGLIGSENEQKRLLMDSLPDYLDFIDKIAEFISVKAQENEISTRQLALLDTLDKVTDSMSQGVFILGENRVVTNINSIAISQLRIKNDCVGSYVQLVATGDTVNDQQEYKLSLNGVNHTVFGPLQSIKSNSKLYRDILLFHPSREM
ncbi:MAG: GAF domain-containing protein, partial [Oscillospiraceae bacterium]